MGFVRYIRFISSTNSFRRIKVVQVFGAYYQKKIQRYNIPVMDSMITKEESVITSVITRIGAVIKIIVSKCQKQVTITSIALHASYTRRRQKWAQWISRHLDHQYRPLSVPQLRPSSHHFVQVECIVVGLKVNLNLMYWTV